MQIKRYLNGNFIKQFLSYFCVGGLSAIVEWVAFAIFSNLIGINYIAATCIAFLFSTTVNWLLGRLWTFKGNKSYEGKQLKEVLLVFAVSAIGLLFNMLLMYLLVSVLGLNTDVLKIVSKIIATGIVFIWNFLIRRFAIYK